MNDHAIERFVEVFVFLNFLVIGASHITQARAWDELFALLRSKGRSAGWYSRAEVRELKNDNRAYRSASWRVASQSTLTRFQ